MIKKQRQVSDLLQVLEVSRKLASSLDLQTLLTQIEKAAVSVLDCERATVFVHDKQTGDLYSYVHARKEKIRFSANQGIAGACFNSGKLLNIPDAYQDSRFESAIDKRTGFKTRNILATPLVGDNEQPLGVLEVLNKAIGDFDAWDITLLETLAAQCGVAIHRQFLLEEFAKRQRSQRDLAIARQIQRSLLPESAPAMPGFDIAGWSQAAEEAGGDFFDFQPLNSDELLMVIADVAGHGIGPALLAAECCALLRAVFSLQTNIQQGLNYVNQLLCRHIPEDRFITAFIGILNPTAGVLNYISAGHGPIIILRNSNQSAAELPIQGMPLGIMGDYQYDACGSIQFAAGDVLIALTDGFFEWENAEGHSFGYEHVCRAALNSMQLPAAKIIENIYTELLCYAQGTKQEDDLTAIVIKMN
jgi:phosphoserine phosphatase RsbU/P